VKTLEGKKRRGREKNLGIQTTIESSLAGKNKSLKMPGKQLSLKGR
jgi:hypothetical protein